MIFISLLCLFLTSCHHQASTTYRLFKSYDADSMQVVDYNCHDLECPQTEIRLLGVDAPEKTQEPWGLRAKEFFLSKIHDDTKLYIEPGIPALDKYGRTLAFLFYEDESGKHLFNSELLRNGYAQLFILSPSMKHLTELKDAEATARAQRLHIWQSGNGLTMSPYKFRKLKARKSSSR